MSDKPTIIGRAAVVTQSAGKRAVPVGVLVALLTAVTGWFTSHTNHDSSESRQRETVTTLVAKMDNQAAQIVQLQISVAVLEDRWESEGADTVSTVEHLPPAPRLRKGPSITYDDIIEQAEQHQAE